MYTHHGSRRRRILIILISLFVGVLFGISYYMVRKLTQRKKSSSEQKVLLHKMAHKTFYEDGQGRSFSVKTDDNLLIKGVFLPRRNAKGTVIMCHGFHRDKESIVLYVPVFEDWNICTFDFRACGESEGELSSIGANEHKDVLAVARYIKKLDHGPIILFGASMGAAAAIKASCFDSELCDALVIDSAYACLHEEMGHVFSEMTHLPYYPFFPLMARIFYWITGPDASEMRPLEYLKQLDKPILFIHAATDKFTLPEHSLRMYAAAAPYNKHANLWIGPPAKHAHLIADYPELYRSKVSKFLGRIGL